MVPFALVTTVPTATFHAAAVTTVASVLAKEIRAPVSPMAHHAATIGIVASVLAKVMFAYVPPVAHPAAALPSAALISSVKVTTVSLMPAAAASYTLITTLNPKNFKTYKQD